MKRETNKIGKVILIGAGPGDPDLITVKGKKMLAKADVVIYDYLANQQLLNYCPPRTEMIYVGKKAGAHTLPQSEINKLLIEKVMNNNLVVRLKGGDPFIFGRGGEEILSLVEAGILFEVVPGITAGTAALTYAGIPATHRGGSTSISFITGHEDPTKNESGLNWQAISSMEGTLVFYMGIKNLPFISKNLISNGKSSETPTALIRWGTLPTQKTLVGTLGDIAEKAKNNNFKPPALIVVGDVVHHRNQMNWFEQKPLFGKRIVITRARAQSSDLVSQLNELGAEVIEFPTIRIETPPSWQPLDDAIQNLQNYDWIVFTSVNGVERFWERLITSGSDVRLLNGLNIAAIGPATSQRLRQFGVTADLQPEKFVAESLVSSLKAHSSLAGKNFLLPRAEEARSLLKDELMKFGAEVDEIVAYRTIIETAHQNEVLENIRLHQLDLITFTSSSTVNNFVSIIGKNHVQKMKNVIVACIGPITAKTASSFGLEVKIMPEDYTIPAMVQSILDYYNKI